MPKTAVVILLIVASGLAVAGSLWLRRNTDLVMRRAPMSAQLTLFGLLAVGIILQQAELVSEDVLLAVLVPAFLILLAWGWVRHARSPYRQRWERTWAQVDKLISRDPAAADRVLMEASAQDAAELEKLRALVPTDRRAAREFRAGVVRELRHLGGSEKALGRFIKGGKAGADGLTLILQKRRSKLEEDLAWVARFLKSPGAA